MSEVPAMATSRTSSGEDPPERDRQHAGRREALLAEAAAIPIRPRVQRYVLTDANRALQTWPPTGSRARPSC